MVKKRIIVTGNVQGVGYRAFVRWFANEFKVAGRVRNLPDRSVEIYCEGDAKALDNFIKAIDVKSQDIHMLKMNVKSMTIHEEGTKEYLSSKAPKKFKDFEVNYGPGLKKIDREAMERDEITVLAAQDLSNRVDGVGRDVKSVGQDVRAMHEDVKVVGNKVASMHEGMNERFTDLDGKYHIIGEGLVEMNKNNAKTNENIKELIEGNAKTNENIKNLTETMMKIVEDYIAGKKKHQDNVEGQT
jgi:acylphosphatase